MPFVARGSGTSLSGGSLPFAGGIVITLNRLNRILRLDPKQRIGGPTRRHQRAVGAAPARTALRARPVEPVDLHDRRQRRLRLRRRALPETGDDLEPRARLRSRPPDGKVVGLGTGSPEHTGPDWLAVRGLRRAVRDRARSDAAAAPPPEARTRCSPHTAPRAAGDAVASIVAAGLLPVAIEIMDALALEAAGAAVRPAIPTPTRC